MDIIIGVRNELGGGFSRSLIHQKNLLSAPHIDNLHQLVESNCKIVIMWEMMNESFDPNIDCHTKENLIQSVAYNQV